MTKCCIVEAEETYVERAEAGAPKFICPSCRTPLALSESARQELHREVESWDRRFDRPQTIVNSILDVIAEDLSRPEGHSE